MTTPVSGASQPLTFDPWDERVAVVPVGLLAVLYWSAERADSAALLRPPGSDACVNDPCEFCTALSEAESIMHGHDLRVNGYDTPWSDAKETT